MNTGAAREFERGTWITEKANVRYVEATRSLVSCA